MTDIIRGYARIKEQEASGLCRVCPGTGSLFAVQNGRLEWHTCPACHGYGTRNSFRGAPSIRTHAA